MSATHTPTRPFTDDHVLDTYLKAGSVEDAAQWLLEDEAAAEPFASTSDMEIAYSDLCARVKQVVRDCGGF